MDKSIQYLYDDGLSLRAKGLLTIFLNNPDLSQQEILKLTADGAQSIRSTVKELAKSGFLKIENMRDKGRMHFKYIGAPYPKYKK